MNGMKKWEGCRERERDSERGREAGGLTRGHAQTCTVAYMEPVDIICLGLPANMSPEVIPFVTYCLSNTNKY